MSELTRRATALMVPTLVAAQLVVMLDSSILNVALPSIASDYGLDATQTAWILNAYFLAFGGLLLIAGRAADIFGRRRMFVLGAATLAIGSLVGAFAPTEAILITSRVVQGVGSAMLSPAAMSVILARFTGSHRARATSWWGAASTAGGALGVSLGGLLTGSLGWRSAMALTGLVALAILCAGGSVLPADEASERRPFDGLGAGLLTAAVTAAVSAVLAAPRAGITSNEVLVAATVALAAAVAFVIAERRATDPVLSLRALSESRVAGGIAVNMLGGAARIACFALVALLLQQVLQYAPTTAGLAMLPTSVAGFAISTLLLPRMLARYGAERTVILGLLLLTAAHLLLALVHSHSSYVWHVLPALFLAAAGVAYSFTPTTLVIAAGMRARDAGVSSGLASATAQLGGAVGIAIFGAVDAMGRSRIATAGGTALEAAQNGLSVAHSVAAIAASVAIAVAALTFPAVSGRRTPLSTAPSLPLTHPTLATPVRAVSA